MNIRLLFILLIFIEVYSGETKKIFIDSKGIYYNNNIYYLNNIEMYKIPQVFIVVYYNPANGIKHNNAIYLKRFMIVSQLFYTSYPNEMKQIYDNKCDEYFEYFKSGYCIGFHRDFPTTKIELENFKYYYTEHIIDMLNCYDCEVRYYDDE